MPLSIRINGKRYRISAPSDTPLLYVLTNDIGLKGPRFGCGMAQCGSCSVLADGKEIRSCVMPVGSVARMEITTLEGLARFDARKRGLTKVPDLHPLQQAIIDEQALQCGYCYNGMAVKGAELLASNPNPSEAEIRDAMAGHICRCGTYQRISAAIKRAAATIGGKT
ncbi:(2Fe-2S)-binding protein [Cupriavidus necator]